MKYYWLFCLVLIFSEKCWAQPAPPSTEVVERLHGKLSGICLSLKKNKTKLIVELADSDLHRICACAVPNAARQLILENIRDIDVAYAKLNAHVLMCGERKIKAILKKEYLVYTSSRRQPSIRNSAKISKQANCVAEKEYLLYLNTYQKGVAPNDSRVDRDISICYE